MKNTSGFTLMELMVVIAIIAIVSAISVPNMIAWRSNHMLNSSAREVMAFINEARMAAIKNNATVNVAIETANKKVTSQYTNRLTGESSSLKEVRLNPGIQLAANTFTENKFKFNSRGIPTEGGTIGLKKSNGETREVVMEITGITRIN